MTSEPAPSASDTAEPEELTSSPYSLHRAVNARRSEFVRSRQIRVKVGTWNVAALPGTDKDLASWFVSGKGVDKTLASLKPSQNPAIERDDSFPSEGVIDGDDDGEAVRLLGGDDIDLFVLGLQEVVDLGPSQYLNRVVAEDTTREKWKAALQASLPDGYQLVSCEQMSGLLLLVYASATLAPTVSDVCSCSIGTGMMGWVGNKGAVATRIVLGETTSLAFVNCHLASGHDVASSDRRIWDAGQVLSRTLFTPTTYSSVSGDASDTLDKQDFDFWFGDLNFRLDGLPGNDIRHLLSLHTRGEYGLVKKEEEEVDPEGDGVVVRRASESSDDTIDGSFSVAQSTEQAADDPSALPLPDPDGFDIDPHDDPASLQATLDSLLTHDQLGRLMKAHKIFHDGWREGSITFLPTYKYDVGAVSLFDSSEKKRAPSWCDRVLYRTRADKEGYEKRVKEKEEARRRDEEMRALGVEEASEDDEVLFDYDPSGDAESRPAGKAGFDYDEYDDEEDGSGEQAAPDQASPDRIHLDVYTSHQRIMSSDHKPIASIFTLDYDAVVPELKAKVHAEVARELDRAENEGRPVVTIVIDGHEHAEAPKNSDSELSKHALDFGEVGFLRKESASLTLANTGGVAATFSFVEKPTTEDSEGRRPDLWLSTSFSRLEGAGTDENELGTEVTLEPGETVKAVVEIYVSDVAHARLLNDSQASLEDVLVLRVADGRDHFIPVRASWSPTCIGRSIDELIRIPNGGIKSFIASRSGPDSQPGSIPYDSDVHFAAPKELFKLTEAVEVLAERTLADAMMLEELQVPQEAGWPLAEGSWKYAEWETRRRHIIRLIEVLDNDKPIADAFVPETPSLERLERVSEVLVLFLRGLTDGIITVPLWARIEQAPLHAFGRGDPSLRQTPEEAVEDDKAEILDILSSAPNHNISFVFLTTTIAKIISDLAPATKSDPEEPEAATWGVGSLGRRTLGFRRSVTGPAGGSTAAFAKQQAKRRKFAEILGQAVCRAPKPGKDKEKRSLEDRQRAVVELFLKKREA